MSHLHSHALSGNGKPCLYRFASFEFSTHALELRRSGTRVRVQDQPLRVLAVLLRHAGELVPRDVLQRELWGPDIFVDFDLGLNSAVRKLRQALNDSPTKPQYIETLARRGYRFLEPVAVFEIGDCLPSQLYPADVWIRSLADNPTAAQKPQDPALSVNSPEVRSANNDRASRSLWRRLLML